MSYDLMVFDPQGPPRDRKGFMEWYRQQTQWNEGHSYDNADVTTPDLRAWYRDMFSQYPAMNGPDSSGDVDNPKVTDYSIGRSAIYAAFSWSEAEGGSKWCSVWPKSIASDSLTLALKTEAYGYRRHPETICACMEMVQRPRTGNGVNARRRDEQS